MSNHYHHNITKGERSHHQIDTDVEVELKQLKRNEIEIETEPLVLSKMPPYQSTLHDTIDDTIDIDTIGLDIDNNNDNDRPHVVLLCNPQEDTEEEPPEDRITKKEIAHNNNQAHTHQIHYTHPAVLKQQHPVASNHHHHQHHLDHQLYNHQRTTIPEAMFHLEKEAHTASTTEIESYTGASSGSDLDDSTIDSTSTFNEQQVDRTAGFDEEENDEEASSVQVEVGGGDRESANTTPVGEAGSFEQYRRSTSWGVISEQHDDGKQQPEPALSPPQQGPRRVTFAGQVVRCPEDPRRILEVLDAVTVLEITHVSEYSTQEKRAMWYTRDEMTQMKALCIDTVRRAISKHQYNHSIGVSAEQETLYCRFFFLRGLERFVDYYNVVNKEGATTKTKDTTSSSTDREGGQGGQASQSSQSQSQSPDSKQQRDDGGITAVLQEQYNQRLTCLQRHRVVYGGILDPEQLRAVYETQGNTTASLHDAQELAQQDARHVTEYCLIDDAFHNDFDITLNGYGDSYTSAHYDDDNNNDNEIDYTESERHHSHRHKNNKKSSTTTKIHAMMRMKPTMIFDVLGVNKILRTWMHPLISPIVDVRHGDIFLKIENHESCLS
mmetsp:Transcript_43981/g.50710  ORF Transcript_43981/g.50710 Transcript_43981/m.50710 type:complete len:608 (+) Transcript_43981:85-1908(+)